MAFSCRLGAWGRAIGVTCEKRCPPAVSQPFGSLAKQQGWTKTTKVGRVPGQE